MIYISLTADQKSVMDYQENRVSNTNLHMLWNLNEVVNGHSRPTNANTIDRGSSHMNKVATYPIALRYGTVSRQHQEKRGQTKSFDTKSQKSLSVERPSPKIALPHQLVPSVQRLQQVISTQSVEQYAKMESLKKEQSSGNIPMLMKMDEIINSHLMENLHF